MIAGSSAFSNLKWDTVHSFCLDCRKINLFFWVSLSLRQKSWAECFLLPWKNKTKQKSFCLVKKIGKEAHCVPYIRFSKVSNNNVQALLIHRHFFVTCNFWVQLWSHANNPFWCYLSCLAESNFQQPLSPLRNFHDVVLFFKTSSRNFMQQFRWLSSMVYSN